MRFERHHTAEEQVRVAAELVDDEADDGRSVLSRKRRFDAENLGEYAAAINVADQHDWAIRGAREPHIGDVALAQVDLGCAARAFDEHEVPIGAYTRVAVEYGAHQFGFEGLIFARSRIADNLALDDDLRAELALRLQQDRVHVHARRNSAGARLQRLGAADLAAVVRHRSVVRHVLRLERADAKPAPGESAAEAGDDQRFADVRSRPLEHQRSRGQNSIASCARTPAAKWCFTSANSVTQSAAAIISGLALRPVTTTCRPERRSTSAATTSASGR